MGMKLLKKSEVSKAQSVEQRTAVEEGLKIARSVDNLREIRAEEERSLVDFRVKSIETIHEEIKSYSEKLENIKREVQFYEERRKDALKPLQEERLRCESQAAALREREEGINDREYAVGVHELAIEVAGKELQRQQESINRVLEALADESEESDARSKETKSLIAQAQDALAAANRIKRDTEDALTHRESQVAEREGRATLQETANREDRKVIEDEWRLLNDRKAMLERSKKRINNQ